MVNADAQAKPKSAAVRMKAGKRVMLILKKSSADFGIRPRIIRSWCGQRVLHAPRAARAGAARDGRTRRRGDSVVLQLHPVVAPRRERRHPPVLLGNDARQSALALGGIALPGSGSAGSDGAVNGDRKS